MGIEPANDNLVKEDSTEELERLRRAYSGAAIAVGWVTHNRRHAQVWGVNGATNGAVRNEEVNGPR